jgi:hypothetical protein
MFMLTSLCCCAILMGPPESDPQYGHIWQPAFALDTALRSPAIPYEPQPGDLVLLNAGEKVWNKSYYLALSGPPTHSALVFRKPDGTFGFLEGGIGLNLQIEVNPLAERLPKYYGDLYVRRRKTPLTQEESDRLTECAMATDKQRVTIIRFPLQATMFRTRGPLRIEYLGKARGLNGHTWTCSELVIEVLAATGLLDSETARPAATYPRDLFFDQSANQFLNRHLSPQIEAGWHPPRLWTRNEAGLRNLEAGVKRAAFQK